MVELGDPEDVGNRYLELNFSEQAREAERAAAAEAEGGDRSRARARSLPPGSQRPAARARPAPRRERRPRSTSCATATGRAEILEAWFEDERGERAEVLADRSALHVRGARALQRGRREPALRDQPAERAPRPPALRLQPLERAALRDVSRRARGHLPHPFENVLAPDRYYVDARGGPPRRRLDRPPRADGLGGGDRHAPHRRAARPALRASRSSATRRRGSRWRRCGERWGDAMSATAAAGISERRASAPASGGRSRGPRRSARTPGACGT